MKPLSLEQLQRRFVRLQTLQRRLARAAATNFTAGRNRYDLPLSVITLKPSTDIPQRVVDYLAGFFDGDGCVSRHRNEYQLNVAQAESGSEVLLLFRNMLGGGIYSKGNALGGHQSALQWSVFHERARHAANTLSRSSCSKRGQLQLAGAALSERNRLKSVPPSRGLCPSWSYAAGFFDAEGSIAIRYPASMTLRIEQKHPHALYILQEFLMSTGIECSVRASGDGHVLQVNRTDECRDALRRLLSAGLRVKRHAATISLELAPGNFHHVRSKLQDVVGLQSRYRRLTAAGAERAYEIDKMRHKVNRSGGTSKAECRRQLLHLRATHGLKCAEERYLLLRADIRSQLRKGAWIRNA